MNQLFSYFIQQFIAVKTIRMNRQIQNSQKQQYLLNKQIKMQRTKQQVIRQLLKSFQKQNCSNSQNIPIAELHKASKNSHQQIKQKSCKFTDKTQTRKWINKQSQKLKPVFYPSASQTNHYQVQQRDLQDYQQASFLQNFIRQKQVKSVQKSHSKSKKQQLYGQQKTFNKNKLQVQNQNQQGNKTKLIKRQERPNKLRQNQVQNYNKSSNKSSNKNKQILNQNQAHKIKIGVKFQKNNNIHLSESAETQKNGNNQLKKVQSNDASNLQSDVQEHIQNNHDRSISNSAQQSVQNVTRNDLELINYLTSIKKKTGGKYDLSEDQIHLKQLNFGNQPSDYSLKKQSTEHQSQNYFDNIISSKPKPINNQYTKSFQKISKPIYPLSHQLQKQLLKEDKKKTQNNKKQHQNNSSVIKKNQEIQQPQINIKPSKLHLLLKNKKEKNVKTQQQQIKNKRQINFESKQEQGTKKLISKYKNKQQQNVKEVKKWGVYKNKLKQKVKEQVNKSGVQQYRETKYKSQENKQIASQNNQVKVKNLIKQVQQTVKEVHSNLQKIDNNNKKQRNNQQQNLNKLKLQLGFSDLSSESAHPYAISFSKFSDAQEKQHSNQIKSKNQMQNEKQNLSTQNIQKPVSKDIQIDLSQQIKKIQQEQVKNKNDQTRPQRKNAKVRVVQLCLDEKQDTIQLRQSDQLNYVSSSEDDNKKQPQKHAEQSEPDLQNNHAQNYHQQNQQVQLRKYVSSSQQHSLQKVLQVEEDDDQKKDQHLYKRHSKKSINSQKSKLQKQFLSDFTQSDISMVKSDKPKNKQTNQGQDEEDLQIQKSIINQLKNNVQDLKSKMLNQVKSNKSKNQKNSNHSTKNLFKQFQKKGEKHIQIDLTQQLKQMSQKSKKKSSQKSIKIKSNSSEVEDYQHLFDLNSSSSHNNKKSSENMSFNSQTSQPKKQNKSILDQFQHLNQVNNKKKSEVYKDFNNHISKLKEKMSSDYMNEGSVQVNKQKVVKNKNDCKGSSSNQTSNQTSNQVSRKGSSGASNAFSAVQQIPESQYLTNLKFSQKPSLKGVEAKNDSEYSQDKNKGSKELDSHSLWGLIQRTKQ